MNKYDDGDDDVPYRRQKSVEIHSRMLRSQRGESILFLPQINGVRSVAAAAASVQRQEYLATSLAARGAAASICSRLDR